VLRSLQPKLTLFVIDDIHDSEHEGEALRLSASQYLCKPVQLAWIEAWHGPAGSSPLPVSESYRLPTEVGRRF